CIRQAKSRLAQNTVGRRPNSSHSSETGTLSTRCRLRMATFSSGVKCFRSFLIRSLRYLNGRTLSPFPAEAGQCADAPLIALHDLGDRHWPARKANWYQGKVYMIGHN